MPQQRARYVSASFLRALTHSPIVGVLGQRQVGKTTLVSSLANESVSLDVAKNLEFANQNPDLFLEKRSFPLGIDEAQLSPSLFPALKEWVRVHPKKGQVILTGSVRFTSRKAIRESLTGRIANVEVLPFTVSELKERPLPQFLKGIADTTTQAQVEKFNDQHASKTISAFDAYLEKGGLPGICFFRDASIRYDRFEGHLDTLLYRDLQLVIQTTTTSTQLKSLFRFLSETQGDPLSLTEASRFSSISTITVKKILSAFEALFLIRTVPSEGTVSKPAYFIEDQGTASFASKAPFQKNNDILRGLYANLRQEVFYAPLSRGEVFCYHTHDGATVPLVLRSALFTVGIIPVDEDKIHRKALESSRSFQQQYPGAKVIFAYLGKKAFTHDFKSFAIPYWWLV